MSTPTVPSTGSPTPRRTMAPKIVSKEENVKVGTEGSSAALVSDMLERILPQVSNYHTCDNFSINILGWLDRHVYLSHLSLLSIKHYLSSLLQRLYYRAEANENS